MTNTTYRNPVDIAIELATHNQAISEWLAYNNHEDCNVPSYMEACEALNIELQSSEDVDWGNIAKIDRLILEILTK